MKAKKKVSLFVRPYVSLCSNRLDLLSRMTSLNRFECLPLSFANACFVSFRKQSISLPIIDARDDKQCPKGLPSLLIAMELYFKR